MESTSVSQIGGLCPVQAEGVIDGHSFYFRARGSRWSIEIGGDIDAGKPLWTYSESYGAWPDAGWMPEGDALRFIDEAAARFRETATPAETAPSGPQGTEAALSAPDENPLNPSETNHG